MQKEGKTCVIEMMCTKELDDPFRRDAMSVPKRQLEKYQKFLTPTEDIHGQPTDVTRK